MKLRYNNQDTINNMLDLQKHFILQYETSNNMHDIWGLTSLILNCRDPLNIINSNQGVDVLSPCK